MFSNWCRSCRFILYVYFFFIFFLVLLVRRSAVSLRIVSFIRCRTVFLNNFIIWNDGIYNCHISVRTQRSLSFCLSISVCLSLSLSVSAAFCRYYIPLPMAYLPVIIIVTEEQRTLRSALDWFGSVHCNWLDDIFHFYWQNVIPASDHRKLFYTVRIFRYTF